MTLIHNALSHSRRPLVVLGNATNLQSQQQQELQGSALVVPLKNNKSSPSPVIVASKTEESTVTPCATTPTSNSNQSNKVFRYAQWRDLEGSLKITDTALLFRPHPCTSPRSKCFSTVRRLYWHHLESHQAKVLPKASKYLLRLNVVRPNSASTLVLRLSSAEELQCIDREIQQRLQARREKEEEEEEISDACSISSIQCLKPSSSSVSSVGMESPSVGSYDESDDSEDSSSSEDTEDSSELAAEQDDASGIPDLIYPVPSTKQPSKGALSLAVMLLVLLAAILVIAVPSIHSTRLLRSMPLVFASDNSPAVRDPLGHNTSKRTNRVVTRDQTSTRRARAPAGGTSLALVAQQQKPASSSTTTNNPLQSWSSTLATLVRPSSKTCLGIFSTTMDEWIDSCTKTSSIKPSQSQQAPSLEPKKRATNPLLHFGMGAVV